MARKWSRMVSKNTKLANERRKKTGKDTMIDKNAEEKFIGRSWLLPSFLMGLLSWYIIFFYGTGGFMFWFTVAGYIVLSLFLFFLKRPFLVVGKDYIESRRFGGVFKIPSNEIEKIVFSNDSVTISFHVKRPSWTFTKLFQRMNIPEMINKLQLFADSNQIKMETKGKL